MDRRARNRARARDRDASIPRDRMARVRVDEPTWREFRQAVGYRPIAERLGELVARDVAAYRRHQLQAGDLHARAVLDALDRADALSRDLAAITERLEQLRPAPPNDGHNVESGPQRMAAHRPILGEDAERPAGRPVDADAAPFSHSDRPAAP